MRDTIWEAVGNQERVRKGTVGRRLILWRWHADEDGSNFGVMYAMAERHGGLQAEGLMLVPVDWGQRLEE